ncbi:fumarylacetoacetate hydrolase family protein [Gemmata sp. JC717]|uniref:fumarylacetoacetate hydrolase family protein n=1 Tax=Gemmata algarum TaxID=2975278 RepID=UPI0021BAD2D2|nr:fumarylacetoacetate hydrolase family protein [Gemmata algarum]MDY3555342.1 fumarylacetoacetate hydrolase family protein [Gemmata algarum]
MQFGKALRGGRETVVAVERGVVYPLDLGRNPAVRTLADLLHAPDPVATARELLDTSATADRLETTQFRSPVDQQEVWAAGVTYKRSKIAREEESVGAAQFYDKVYSAPRPELFLKATPARVVAPGSPVRVRTDATWSVPEPELALVISPAGTIVGYTIGNDMSSRDIEGENPLYLPQAKIYRGSCSVGPLVTPAALMPELPGVEIRLVIARGGSTAFEGSTTLAQMARTVESLAEWLFKENEFPHGALLLTGTGIVPPDDFTLKSGDDVSITIAGIGTLRNPVA